MVDFLVWIFKDTNCTLQHISRKMQRNLFFFFSRSPTRFQSHSLCSLPQPNCAQDTSYLTTLPSSSDINPHRCTGAAHGDKRAQRKCCLFYSLVNTNMISRFFPKRFPCLGPQKIKALQRLFLVSEGRFRKIFVSVVYPFDAGSGAFMKMSERWPPPTLGSALKAFSDLQLPTRLPKKCCFRLYPPHTHTHLAPSLYSQPLNAKRTHPRKIQTLSQSYPNLFNPDKWVLYRFTRSRYRGLVPG